VKLKAVLDTIKYTVQSLSNTLHTCSGPGSVAQHQNTIANIGDTHALGCALKAGKLYVRVFLLHTVDVSVKRGARDASRAASPHDVITSVAYVWSCLCR